MDDPATRESKRARLTAAGIAVPETLTLIPVDFETQYLATELEDPAFSRTNPLCWSGAASSSISQHQPPTAP
ncbi:class I SAM-dependent methyltransferase [Mycobacteroides chelonae]|uniref:class I SAM-dependent methyltransferase n=1 Tax=Mycobacteroides chelonae TaxID=1774 RepID=UPI002E1215AC|nr:class I SAM-dependent methyltransferase [Mycobacteroides chelonae]